MSTLRLGLLALAVGTFLASFVFFLPAPPRIEGGLFNPMGPGMMGGGMMGGRGGPGPGMMGGGFLDPRETPSPTPVIKENNTSNPIPGIILLLFSGSSLVGWWVSGRPSTVKPSPPENPLTIAQRRYIEGEISLLEYDQIVQTILQSSEAPALKPAEYRTRRHLP